MQISFIDHIVFIVKNIPQTEKFYNVLLTKPSFQTDDMLIYAIGDTQIFFVLPTGEYENVDKDKGGLNHLAFGVRSLDELKSFEAKLGAADIKNSGIKIDVHGGKDYIWLDDPSNIRIEIYCRPK